MATNTLSYDATARTGVDAITALLNGGFLKIYTGSQPSLNGAVTGTLLVSLPLSATAFAASVASAGTVTATANAISSATAVSTGTAGYYVLVKSDNSTVVLAGTCGTSGANLNMSNTAVSIGATVSVSSFTITELQNA